VGPKVATRIRSRREQLRRLAVVYKAEIRLKIITELYMREMSPKEFYEEFGGRSAAWVAQHFKALEKHGWLRRVGQKPRSDGRQGPPEILYRATDLVFFDAETWALLPYSVRLAFSWSSFEEIAERMRQGIEASLLEGRPGRPLTCTTLRLDQLGWTRVTRALATQFETLYEEQDDAKIRVARTGGRADPGRGLHDRIRIS
jgi:DNA-binding HxlR family transcriptional regulator